MVATAHPQATEAGLQMLQAGGNAIDAAVAAAFVLGVVEPYSSGIGGGGFALIRDGANGKALVLDFREVAPAAATRDMYLDDAGAVIAGKSVEGALAVAVPGQVAGLCQMQEEWGTLPLAQVMGPAISAAGEGFRANEVYISHATNMRERLAKFPESGRIFLAANGGAPAIGELVQQVDQARTLEAIASSGAKAFYEGPIAEAIATEVTKGGGILTIDDLKSYKPTVREPLVGDYRGYEILTMPPPSSGGVHLIQILNILSAYDLRKMGWGSAEAIHLMVESEKRAYADRAQFLGDPAFVKVPVNGLTSAKYAAGLRMQLRTDKATPSDNITAGDPAKYDSPETTHLCVIDRAGTCVSLTSSINYSFGSGVTVTGTGILLNNTMDDFSAAPGTPNVYGLVGGEANSIAPKKIPLSSMTPTIVVRQGQPLLVIGSPGGSRIITTVLQAVINTIDHHMNVSEAINTPRFHHQWLPDEIKMEPRAIAPDAKKALESLGHRIIEESTWSNATGIWRDPETGEYFGAADARGVGTAMGY